MTPEEAEAFLRKTGRAPKKLRLAVKRPRLETDGDRTDDSPRDE